MGYNTMKKEILFQFDIAWQLFEYHCQNLNDDEALWCINENGLQIRKKDTTWIPDWPDTEDYAIGPSSISLRSLCSKLSAARSTNEFL